MVKTKISPPNNHTATLEVIGFINYFRLYVPKLASKLIPLTDRLIIKGKSIAWSKRDNEIICFI